MVGLARRDSSLWTWTGRRFKYIGPTVLPGRQTTVYVSERMLVTFQMNRGGIARIAVDAPLKAAVHALVVGKAMPYAIQISPRGHTLEYVSSWRVVDTYEVIAGMRRVAARLFNDSGHAAAVEWVSRRGFGHGYDVLGRTLAHLNATSPIAVAGAARPGGAARPRGGRFVAKASAGTLRQRASNAAKIRKRNP